MDKEYAQMLKDHQKSLRDMYDLGVEHGRELQKKDMEIEALKKELGLE